MFFAFVLLVTTLHQTLCDPMDVAHQAPLSLGFPRQEYWSGLPFTFPSMYMYTKWYAYYFCGILKCKINKGHSNCLEYNHYVGKSSDYDRGLSRGTVIWLMFIKGIWVNTLRCYHAKHFKSEKAKCKCLFHLFFSSELVETEPWDGRISSVQQHVHLNFFWNNAKQGVSYLYWSAMWVKTNCFYVYLLKLGGFPGGSAVKNLPAVPEMWVWSWVMKTLWRRNWQPTPVFLPGKSHGQRSLGDYSAWDAKSWIWLSLWTWLCCVWLFATP